MMKQGAAQTVKALILLPNHAELISRDPDEFFWRISIQVNGANFLRDMLGVINDN